MDTLCEQFSIHHQNSPSYRLKINGTAEVANKNIKNILQNMIETYCEWHEKLPFALLASIRYSIAATLLSLVCGMEVVLSLEVEILSLRILMETELKEAEWVRTEYDQLNFIEENKMTTLCHGQCYQRHIARAYDEKVKPKTF